MSPEVTIIIPVYNREKLIGSAIDSVLSQTLENFQLVVVDDGSTDGTWEVLRQISGSDDRVKIKRNLEYPKGPAGARNSGLLLKGGKYVAFLDSDDTWNPDYLEESVKILEENSDVGLVFSDLRRVSENGNVIVSSKFLDETPFPDSFNVNMNNYINTVRNGKALLADAITKRFTMGLHSCVLRVEVFDQLEIMNLRVSEDHFFTLDYLNSGLPFVIRNSIGVNYNIHENNISSVSSKSYRKDFKNIMTEVKALILVVEQNRYSSLDCQKAIKSRIASLLCWQISSFCFEKNGHYNRALPFKYRALTYDPSNIKIVKSFLKLRILTMFRRVRRGFY